AKNGETWNGLHAGIESLILQLDQPFHSRESQPGFDTINLVRAGEPHRDRLKAFLQDFFGIEQATGHHEPGYQSSPSGLMAGADAGAIVTMKIFVKENQISPGGILLEFV